MNINFKYYSSLNKLPIWNYWKVRETMDLKYLISGESEEEYDNISLSESEKGFLSDVWNSLNIDFVDEFGVSDEMFNRLMAEKRVMLLRLEYLFNPKPITKSRLLIEEDNLNNERNKNLEKGNFYSFLAHVEKFMGFPIDEKKTSVSKFYSYVGMMREKYKNKLIQNG